VTGVSGMKCHPWQRLDRLTVAVVRVTSHAACPKQHIVQSIVASIISASNALTNNLSPAPRTPTASTTVL